jgi:methylmalonyl-CoA/ethylmalonyl-CoA epimerase
MIDYLSNSKLAGQLNFFGSSARFHHVGLVVASIRALCPDVEPAVDPVQDVAVAFVELHGTCVELIEPGSAKSPVAASLKKGVKLAHLCFSVADIAAAAEHAAAYEFRTIAEPVSAVAFAGRNISWMYHPVFGLFELIEVSK